MVTDRALLERPEAQPLQSIEDAAMTHHRKEWPLVGIYARRLTRVSASRR
jgi:hypothetical protein